MASVLHRLVKVVAWEFGVDQLEGFTTIRVADHVFFNLCKITGCPVSYH